MLLHHRLVLVLTYGGARPSQWIMPTRSYVMREKRDLNSTGSSGSPRGPAIDRTWQPSRGIKFHTPSCDRSWRPSQGLVFSNRNADSAKDSSSPAPPASATRSLPYLPPNQYRPSANPKPASASPPVDENLLYTEEWDEASGSAVGEKEIQQAFWERDDGCGRIPELVERRKRELKSNKSIMATCQRLERFVRPQLKYYRWGHNSSRHILRRRGKRPIVLCHKVIESRSKNNLPKFIVIKIRRSVYVSGVRFRRFAAQVRIRVGDVREYHHRNGLHRYGKNFEMGCDKNFFVRNIGKSVLLFLMFLRVGSNKPDIPTRESPSMKEIRLKAQEVLISESDRAKLREGTRNEIKPVKQFSSSQAPPTPFIGHLSISQTKPLYSPLGFHIPSTTLQKIKNATSEQNRIHWQYTLYQGAGGEKVIVDYCKCNESTELVAQKFLDQEVIGFDIEWKPQASEKQGIRKNVALIQLASEERIALFHIALYPEGDSLENLVAPSFQKIMESSKITKVGVSIKADCTRLRRFMGIDSHGLFELSHLYKLVKYSIGDAKKINKLLVSLAQQVEEHFELPLWKGEVRSSDWTKPLSDEQLRYAASDSYAAFHLFHFLDAKRNALSPTPPLPSHAELNLPIRLGNDEIIVTDDEPEACDDAFSTSSDASSTSSGDAPETMNEIVRDLNIAREDPTESKPASKKAKSKPLQRSTPAPRPEVAAADKWVLSWRTSRSPTYKLRASPAHLRAYALWHEQRHDILSAAKILRDPPLKKATVAVYVLEALKSEGLPFEKDRIADVMNCLPDMSRARYHGFLRMKGLRGF